MCMGIRDLCGVILPDILLKFQLTLRSSSKADVDTALRLGDTKRAHGHRTGGLQDEPDKGCGEMNSNYVSKGAIPKASTSVCRSHPLNPKNAEPLNILDDLQILDSTHANKPVNGFDFSSLDLSKSMFTSEDHTKILMQADNLLHVTKRQLLDLQMAMTCEEEKFQVESNPPTSSFSRDDSTQPGRDVASDNVRGIESESKTNISSHSFSASKQKKQELVGPKEYRNEKSTLVQSHMRMKPRNFREKPRIINSLPSSSDIEKEIRVTQASLRGGLNAAKGVSALLETMARKEDKEVQAHNSEFEFEKLSNSKFQRGQKVTQVLADNDEHLASQTHNISTPGDATQRTENDPIDKVTNQAGMPDLTSNYEKHNTQTAIPSDVCVCTNQLHEFQSQNPHSQPHICGCEHVASQVKRWQRKLESEESTAYKSTDTKVCKSTSHYCNNSTYVGVCKCGEQKVHMNACNSAVLHLKSSFSSEENRDPQPGSRLVVQTLPSLTIKRDLSVQKVPSVSIPSPDAPPFVPAQQNVGLCKMSHSQIQLEPYDCSSKTLDHKKGADKKLSEVEPKLQGKSRKRTDKKHRHYRGSSFSSELCKRDKITKESTHHDLLFQTKPAVALGTAKCNDREGNVLAIEMKGGRCITDHGRSRDDLKLQAETEFSQRKPQNVPSMSLLKQLSPEQHQTLCERCGNSFLLQDLYYGVCGKCRNIPSPKLEAKHHMYDLTPDTVKSAARLNQCSACLRHFPESELFHGHCIQCQLIKKEMRLCQCSMCLNSVPSTEYYNGKCNRCHYKFKCDTQKDELNSYPAVQGPATYRNFNTVLDGTPLFFDISKAQGTNRSLSSGENTLVQNEKENHLLSGADKESRQNYMVEEARIEIPGVIVNNRTRKNSVKNSKVQFARGKYLITSGNENKSIKKSVNIFKENDKQTLKLQEAQSEKLKSYDDCETHTTIRAADNARATPYPGEEVGKYLSSSFDLKNYDEEGVSSDNNGPRHVDTKASCENVNSDGGSSARNDNTESGSTNSDAEPRVSEDSNGCSRMYVSVPTSVRYGTKEQEAQSHVHNIAAVQMTEDLPKETQKLAHIDIGKKFFIMDKALHHQLHTRNRGERDPDERLQCDAKVFELHEETDESSSRIYNDKYDHTSETVSDEKAGNEGKDFDHGSIFRSSSEENMQVYEHYHYDHSGSLQVADKPKYCMSKSEPHATSKTVDYSQKYIHNTVEYHSGTASNESRRHNTSKYHHHYFYDNYNWRKPIQTEKDVRVKEPQESLRAVTVSKKSSACKNKSKDDDNEEKHHAVTVSMIEDQLLRDVRGQAGEGNGKDMSPGSSVSTIETKNVETSLADVNTSVNEDDVYEEDWEEEPEEEKDSKEDSKDRDDIEPESIEKILHISGDDTEDMSKADNEGAIFVHPSGNPQEQPCHSHCTGVLNPCTDKTCEKTTLRTVMTSTHPVCPANVANKEHYQKPIYVADDTLDLNIPPLKGVDKSSSPIHIPSKKSVSREASSINIPSVEHMNEGPSSVGIADKKCIDRETFPTELPIDKATSTISIQTDKAVDKSTSPVVSPFLKLTVCQRNDSCTNICSHGVQVGESLHGVPLCKAMSDRSKPNLQFARTETQFPEKTETRDDASKRHPEGYQSFDNKVKPLDTALSVGNISRIDTETQTEAVRPLIGLQNDETEKVKRKKQGHLTFVQSQLDDEQSSASASQQEVLPVQQASASQSSSSSSPHENSTEMSGTSASTSDEQLSPSVGECLVSGSACSVGELFVSDVPEEDCSHHTGSHSMGEVWNCHCFETHCLCSEGEIVVDDTIQRGQHIHWKQHASRTQAVNGITGHSSVSVEEDLDSSEGMDNSTPSAGVAQINAERQHKKRNEGRCDQSCMGSTSRSEGELSEGQVVVWQH